MAGQGWLVGADCGEMAPSRCAAHGPTRLQSIRHLPGSAITAWAVRPAPPRPAGAVQSGECGNPSLSAGPCDVGSPHARRSAQQHGLGQTA